MNKRFFLFSCLVFGVDGILRCIDLFGMYLVFGFFGLLVSTRVGIDIVVERG